MNLSPSGRLLAGKAGAAASIDGVSITGKCCGGWDWLYTSAVETAMGQTCDSSTGGACFTQDQDGNRLLDEGIYALACGGGRFVAVGATNPGLRSNFQGNFPPNGYPLKGSFEGDIAFVKEYQQGRDIRICLANGSTIDITTQLAYTVAALRDGLVTWFETGTGVRVYDYRNAREVPIVRLGDSDAAVAARASNGEVILMERLNTNADLRVRRASASTGVIVGVYSPQMQTYNPDMVILPGDRIRTAWSFTQAESIGEYTYRDVMVDELPEGSNQPPIVPGVIPVSVMDRSGRVMLAPADIQRAVNSALSDTALSRSTGIIIIVAVAAALVWVHHS